MTLSRRRFLQITAVGAAAGPLGCAGTVSLDSGPMAGMLDAYIDTLLPADSAPGALQLGVPVQIRDLLRRKRALVPVYRSGLEWLAAQAPQGRGFAELGLAERDALVTKLSVQSDDMLARFFHKSLRHTMMFYYSNPQSWEAFGLDAPQPAGFMDYAQAPRAHG
ncbi:MAG: gluconate 2-dehydrogenase subunit 3 family protein [Halobacteria archaeon]|nr:gluconate 2-dehydrogenase subunit 3 family protein [Halobacteria archaeon]